MPRATAGATNTTADDGTKVIARNAALKRVVGPIDEEGRFTGSGARGLTFPRRWTTAGIHPYDEVTWDLRSAEIKNESGELAPERRHLDVRLLEVPPTTNEQKARHDNHHRTRPAKAHRSPPSTRARPDHAQPDHGQAP